MRFKFKMQNIPKIKICGITNLDDAEEAVRLGADSIGFVFYDKSKKRYNSRKGKRDYRRFA
jgi:phosphoribosylanthranilate isomerase (EC 5.3.1.24)